MSLLFGSWTAESSSGEPDELERCSVALSRYPGIARARSFSDDRCFLAHGQGVSTPEDRLEAQPSLHAEGRFVLAVDGFLTNRDELIGALDLPGAGADSALVATALLRWGEAALEKLHGDFTLAWWDRRERRLLLACDRVGGRTLFYHATERRLFVANLLANLFVHSAVPRALDPDAVARFAFAYSLDLERTCFKDVRQLLPGHKLVWTPSSGARVSRYWSFDPSRRIRMRRDEDYVEAARELLDRVVGEAMRAEGPSVAMLSGGLDSSAVAATAARLLAPVQIHTVTLRPETGAPLPPCSPRVFQDEWPHAQAIAAMHPNMVARGERPAFEPIGDCLRTHMAYMGRPPVHMLPLVWMAPVWRAARDLGAKAVLSGQSGNATLSASARPVSMRPAPADLPAAVSDALWTAWDGRRLKPLKRLLRPLGLPATALRPEAAERIGLADIYETFATGERQAPWHARARLRLIERTWIGRSMTAPLALLRGVEMRDPLGDVRLAEFCLALPADQFTRGTRDRLLARRVLTDRLPPQVTQDRRIGRQCPEWFDWLSRNRPWLAAELDGIDASATGRELIDVPRLRAILDDWPADAAAAEPHYGRLMTVLGRGVGLGAFVRWAEGANL